MSTPVAVGWRTHVATWMRFVTRNRLAPYHQMPLSAMASLLHLSKPTVDDTVVDLGCGDGNTLLAAVQQYDVKRGIGYELNSKLVDVARQRVQHAQLTDRITIHHADALKADLSAATLIILYLSDHGNASLVPLLKAKWRTAPETRVVTFLFPMPAPLKVMAVARVEGGFGVAAHLYTAESLGTDAMSNAKA